MSLFSFGDYSADIDFTDADVQDRFGEAYDRLKEDLKNVPTVGKSSDLIRAQCRATKDFFDRFLGDGASGQMFGRTNSTRVCLDAIEKIYKAYQEEASYLDELNNKYVRSQRPTPQPDPAGSNQDRARRRRKKRKT